MGRWQVLNRPYVTFLTNAGSSIIMVSLLSKPLNNYSSQRKARTESNYKTKHSLVFVLTILSAVKVFKQSNLRMISNLVGGLYWKFQLYAVFTL